MTIKTLFDEKSSTDDQANAALDLLLREYKDDSSKTKQLTEMKDKLQQQVQARKAVREMKQSVPNGKAEGSEAMAQMQSRINQLESMLEQLVNSGSKTSSKATHKSPIVRKTADKSPIVRKATDKSPIVRKGHTSKKPRTVRSVDSDSESDSKAAKDPWMERADDSDSESDSKAAKKSRTEAKPTPVSRFTSIILPDDSKLGL